MLAFALRTISLRRRPTLRGLIIAMATFIGVTGCYIGWTAASTLSRADEVAARQYGQTSFISSRKAGDDTTLLWDVSTFFHRDVVRLIVLAPGSSGPIPPGISSRPGVGTVLVSPALQVLLRSEAGRADLEPRLPGPVTGVIGSDGLAEADELRAYVIAARPDPSAQTVGEGVNQLKTGDARVVTAFTGDAETRPTTVLVLVLALTAAVLPVGALTAAAARIRSAEADARLAALWLLGLSRSDLNVVEAVRTATAALMGATLALGLSLVAGQVIEKTMPERAPYLMVEHYPWLTVLLAALACAAVAVAAVVLAGRWSAESAFTAVRAQTQPAARVPSRAVLLAAGVSLLLVVLALVASAVSPVPVPILLLEYAALATFVVVVGFYLPEAAGLAGARLLGEQGVARLIAGARAKSLPTSTKRGLTALAFVIIVAPTMQAVVTLTEGARADPPAGVTSTQVLVSGPRSLASTIEAVPGVQQIVRQESTTGRPRCGDRYPCSFYVAVDGEQATIEQLRNHVGFAGFVYGYEDPSSNLLYGSSTPRVFGAIRLALLAALLACLLAVMIGLVDGIQTRTRANSALAALGMSGRARAMSYLLELATPAYLVVALSACLGLAVGLQISPILGQGFSLDLPLLAAEVSVCLLALLVATATSFVIALRSASPEHLRVVA